MANHTEKKKPIYKELWVWIVMCLLVLGIALIINSYIENKKIEDKFKNIGNGVSSFYNGINNAKSHLSEFSYNSLTGEVDYNPSTFETVTQSENINQLTAVDILIKLKEKNSNIGKYVVYTEENDINSLLGRPNQYTSKVTFEDIRLEQVNKDLDPDFFTEEEINEPIGGTIEVFNNSKDMQKRKDYIESVTSSFSPLAEYNYYNDYILLRLNKGLTPSQAIEYENIFKEILK